MINNIIIYKFIVYALLGDGFTLAFYDLNPKVELLPGD